MADDIPLPSSEPVSERAPRKAWQTPRVTPMPLSETENNFSDPKSDGFGNS